jgi:hypothetical protein
MVAKTPVSPDVIPIMTRLEVEWTWLDQAPLTHGIGDGASLPDRIRAFMKRVA